MRNEDILDFLRYIKLPRGVRLRDGTTYRLGRHDFPPRKFREDLDDFEKILVLSDGDYHVVGGVLFYGSVDVQVSTLPRYRGHGYMSKIFKNGILAEKCYPGQKASIVLSELRCMEDFLKRHHLLSMIGVRAKNLQEVYKRLSMLEQVNCDEEEFIRIFS